MDILITNFYIIIHKVIVKPKPPSYFPSHNLKFIRLLLPIHQIELRTL